MMKRTGMIALILVGILCMSPAMAAGQFRFAHSMRGLECTVTHGNGQAETGDCAQGDCAGETPSEDKPSQDKPVQETPSQDQPSQDAGQNNASLAQEVIAQTNMERGKAGLSALTVSSELTRAACVRAGEIVRQFSHTRPDGSQWLTVSDAARGENIAKGQQTADKVMAAWMSSSGHRANILRASFGSIGVCAYRVGNVLYWVQLFGK